MEFSEPSELIRITKFRKSSGGESPLTNIITSFKTGKNFPSVTINSLNSSEHSPTGSPICKLPLKPSSSFEILNFESDFSYLNEPTHAKRSSLAMALLSPDKIYGSPLTKQLNLEIYFFCTPQKIRLTVPEEIKVIDMMGKALIEFKKISNLPNGLNLEAYEIWITEDDSYLPDRDYIIDKNSYVLTLSVNVFCICQKIGFKQNAYFQNTQSLALRNLNRPDVMNVKFFFENDAKVIAVNKYLKLDEILLILWKKFFIFGDLRQEMFEFKVFIEEGGYECSLDMSLRINEVGKNEIRLCRKDLADVPKQGHKRLTKSQAIFMKN